MFKNCMMFVLTLKLVFSFLMHVIKRSVYEGNKLVLRNRRCRDLSYSQFYSELDNSNKDHVCDIDHYILHDKDTKFLLNLGSIHLNGNMKLSGRVAGLKNLKETRLNMQIKGSDICTMTEFEASEISIHYDGNVKLSSICPAFLLSAVLKNVKILVEFKIYPFEHITVYLEDVMIDKLKINVNVSGVNVFSWLINFIINITLKVMPFMILCFMEFFTRCYLNKTFSKFYVSQTYVLQKVVKSMVRSASFKAEIEIAREMSRKSKFGPTSYVYNLLKGLMDSNKAFYKVVIANVFNENFNDFLSSTALHSETFNSDLCSTQSNESESYTSSLTNGESESGYDNREQENRINSNEISSEASDSTENGYNNETVSTFSDTSYENEIVYQPENVSCDESNLHLESSNESESKSENASCEDSNLQFEESYECESLHESDSRNESNFQFEESYIESESQSESENNNQSEEINEENNNQSENCNGEIFSQSENNSSEENDTQPENNSSEENDTQSENNSSKENDTQPENNSSEENDTQSENNSSEESDTQPEINFNNDDIQATNSFNAKDDTRSENNFNNEDDNQLEINCNDDTKPYNNNYDGTQPEINYNDNGGTQPMNNFNAKNDIQAEKINGEDDTQSEKNFNEKIPESKEIVHLNVK